MGWGAHDIIFESSRMFMLLYLIDAKIEQTEEQEVIGNVEPHLQDDGKFDQGIRMLYQHQDNDHAPVLQLSPWQPRSPSSPTARKRRGVDPIGT